MKAARIVALRQPVVVTDVPDPVAGPGQALVRLRAAALNHRDVWIQQGLYPGIALPVIPGSDGAGVVEAVGDPADAAWVGREVILNPALDWGPDPRAQGPRFRILGLPDPGTCAERIAIGVAQLAPRPAHLTWEQAAALPLAGLTAWRAVFTRARLRAGERVLVTGVGGGAALFALQFAVAAGAEVWATSSSPAKLDQARALGARGGGDYRASGWAADLARQAGGAFDVIVDSAGGDGFASLVDLAAPGGRLVFFGATAGNPKLFEMRKAFFRQLSVLGTTMGSPEDFAGLVRFVTDHRIVPVVDSVRPLADADAAFRRMADGAQCGKLVLAIGG